MKGNQTRLSAHIIPHTHWDREWYLPFEMFRGRLVQVIDRILELLEEKEHFISFTLDGQTVVLEDYLEVRPENREKLTSFIREGRLEIGPWYVLADEFLTSPESLIRNLLNGMKDCTSFGGRLQTAYTPDTFGHISQLPLLASEFGLSGIVFQRGVGDEGERLRGEFLWNSPDGKAQVFTVHLLGTYSAVTAVGYEDWEYRGGYDEERAYAHMKAVLYGARPGEVDFIPSWLGETFERLPGGITAYATGSELILPNGSDHLFAQENIDEVIHQMNRRFPEVEFIHSTIEQFVSRARDHAGELQEHTGEFRGSRYQHVLSGVLSARMYLKQRNHRCESRLEQITEPLASAAWLQGSTYPSRLLTYGWRTLLKNHAHDSICGCSIDEVHRAMMCRYDSVSQVSDFIEQDAWGHLAGEPGTAYLHVFNPLAHEVTRWVEAKLELPPGSAQQIQITDASGSPLEQMIQAETEYVPGSSQTRQERITLGFEAVLAPLGITSFSVTRNSGSGDGLKQSPLGFENDEISCSWNESGEVTLTHKKTGKSTPLRLRFEVSSDAGDEYDYSPVPGESPLVVQRTVAAPEITADTALKSSLRLSYEISLGRRLNGKRNARIGSAVIPIQLDLTVYRSSPALHLQVHVDNRAEDHRLRLVCSTGCRSEWVRCGGHFDVVKRPVTPPKGEGWYQKPQGTSHTRSFVLAEEQDAGCAVIHSGLSEYEALVGRDGAGEVALTLLRAVGWLSRDDLHSRPEGAGPALPAADGQCLGKHTFDLAVYPFSGPWWDSEVMSLARQCGMPAAVYASDSRCETAGSSLISTDRTLVLSCLKRAEAEDSVIIRVWNPAPKQRKTEIRTAEPPSEIREVRFDETLVAAIASNGCSIPVHFSPGEVKTLAVRFVGTGE